MGFAVSIQSAPELRGTVSAASAWDGASTSVVTTLGKYSGRVDLTFTVTGPAPTGGTVGTGTVEMSWSDATNSGTFDLGASYSAGDNVNLPDGIVLQFAAGTIASADFFTLTVGAVNRVRQDSIRVAGDASPMDVVPTFVSVQDDDLRFRSHDARLSFAEIAQRIGVSLELDYADDGEIKKLQTMRANRHPVTVYGNYDASTVLWYPGYGILPLVGGAPTLTRATAGWGRDPDSGKAIQFASGVRRYGPGVEQTSDAVTNDWEREVQPLRDDHVGRALILGPARNYLLTQSHPKDGTLGWTATGSAVVTWDPDVPPMLDQDDTDISSAFRAGSMRAFIPEGDTIITGYAPISATTAYCAQAWLRATGAGASGTSITVALLTGTGVPGTVAGSEVSVALETDKWTRVLVDGISGGGHNVAAIRVTMTAGTGFVWVSGNTIATRRPAAEWAETDGGTFSQNADAMPWDELLPNGEGSLGFWLLWGGDDGSSTFSMVANAGSPFFKLDWDSGNNELDWHTDSSGGSNALTVSVADWPANTWRHIVLTWRAHSQAAAMTRTIYVDKVVAGTDETTDWAEWDDPWRFASDVWPSDGRVQDVRIDRRAWSLGDVTNIYNRLATDQGKYLARLMTGRTFRISSISESWLHPANPGKQRVSIMLEEWDRADDALVVTA